MEIIPIGIGVDGGARFMSRRSIVALSAALMLLALAPLASQRGSALQLDREIRDRVVPAAVQIAFVVRLSGFGLSESFDAPIGSGTIVTSDGIVLTNAHVVDFTAFRAEIEAMMEMPELRGEQVDVELESSHVKILGTDGGRPAEPLYLARIVERDESLDLAVLQIFAHADGRSVAPGMLNLDFVPLADSATVEIGDSVDIFSYPGATGASLTYTSGVISGFTFEEGVRVPVWINTDATISGGSSGGTAVNRQGELIGVPTQGAELDCRPGDTNRDGEIDASDVGCIPVGGSIGRLRPVALARPLLENAGLFQATEATQGDTPHSVLATIEAYASREAELAQSVDSHEATIAAQATRQAKSDEHLDELAREAAQAAALATESAISAQATLEIYEEEKSTQSTRVAMLESQLEFADGTVSPLATAQAEGAAHATEVAALQAQQADAQVTATALAVVAANSVLDPSRRSIVVQTDLNGILAGDEEALEDVRETLGAELSRYPIGCRAGLLLISGNAPDIPQGIELAERVEALLREFWPDIFTEETVAEQFALPGVQPLGEVNIDVFFYSGCKPIG